MGLESVKIAFIDCTNQCDLNNILIYKEIDSIPRSGELVRLLDFDDYQVANVMYEMYDTRYDAVVLLKKV